MPYEMFGTASWCGAGSVSDQGLDKIACLPRFLVVYPLRATPLRRYVEGQKP